MINPRTKRLPKLVHILDWYLIIYEKVISLADSGMLNMVAMRKINRWANLVFEQKVIKMVEEYQKKGGKNGRRKKNGEI